MEEIELVESLKKGEKNAFDLLYNKYKNQTLRMAYLITSNQYDSEDIVQETFVKCYINIHNLKDNSQFKSWLFQILTRTAWRYCKNKAKEKPTEEIFNIANTTLEPSSLDLILQSEKETILKAEIEKLNLKHRLVVVLYYYNELSTKEIASIIGCFEGTVKSRLHSARQQLKIALKKKGDREKGEFYET